VCILGKSGKEVNLSQRNAFVRLSPKLKSWHSQALSNGQSTKWSKGVKYFQDLLTIVKLHLLSTTFLKKVVFAEVRFSFYDSSKFQKSEMF